MHSRRLVLLKSLLTHAERHAVPPSVRQRLNRHWRLLEQAEGDDPPAFREALAYPSVGTWIMHALSMPPGDGDVLGALAAAVALSTRTGFRMTLSAPGGLLTLPGIGVYSAHAELVRVVAGPRSLRLAPAHRRSGITLLPPYNRATGPGWRGLRPLPGSSTLLDDLDPWRAGTLPAHRSGPPITGGAAADSGRARDWTARWQAALALLAGADPGRLWEIAALVRSVVPITRLAQGGFSATLGSAPGAVITELPETAWGLVAVLVHETHHSKLTVLEDLTPLRLEGGRAVHHVAWRPDPRPVGAVLHGTYAHLALADLWHHLAARRGATPDARTAARARREAYRGQVAEALVVLRGSGELTPEGGRFTDGMAWHLASLTERSARYRPRSQEPVTGR
ncbi:aKG-HExxH-type peptide beta-hydroxylase [Streptomyces bathyalis]|nr:HEXXH motif-containing putative peptide modification protein [Streptomyces bathyalis]